MNNPNPWLPLKSRTDEFSPIYLTLKNLSIALSEAYNNKIKSYPLGLEVSDGAVEDQFIYYFNIVSDTNETKTLFEVHLKESTEMAGKFVTWDSPIKKTLPINVDFQDLAELENIIKEHISYNTLWPELIKSLLPPNQYPPSFQTPPTPHTSPPSNI